MSKEVIEHTINIVSEEKKEKLMKMSETESIVCDDKGLLLEKQKYPCDSSTSKKCVENNTDIKEDYIVEKSIENAENKISVRIDDENNDNIKVETKPLENANLKEKEDQENEPLKEIDTVKKSIENYIENEQHMKIDTVKISIENNAENVIPATIINKNEDKVQVVENPLENANLKEKEDHENEQLMEIDTVKKSIENNIENEQHMKIDTVKISIENNAENIIPATIINKIEDKVQVVENPLENGNLKEKEDQENEQLMEIDTVKKSIENNIDNEQHMKIDTVKISIENNAENVIPVTIINKNEDKVQVVENPLENGNLKEKEDQENEQLMEIDTVKKSIENNIKNEQHIMKIDTVKISIENNAENVIPVTIINKSEDKVQVVENSLENANLKEKEDHENEQLMEIDTAKKSIENNIENEQHMKIDTVKISIENNAENIIPATIINKNEDKVQIVENPLENGNLKQNDGDKDKHFTDDEKNEKKVVSHNAEELELGENKNEDAPIPKDNDQKSEYDADKISEEDIQKKRKNEQVKEENPAENIDEQGVDLIEDKGNPGKYIHKKRKIN